MKNIITSSGNIVPVDDCYTCPECGYTWGGHDRSPPYPHCPKCRDATMRRCR